MHMVIYQIKEREIFDYKDGSSKWVDRQSFYMHEEAAKECLEKTKLESCALNVVKDTKKGFEVYDPSGRLVYETSLDMQIMMTLKRYN